MPKTELDRIAYRKLLPTDHPAFEAHLRALDPESRRTRFGMAANDAFLEQYAARCITLNAIIHGAFLDNRMIGAAELRPLGELFTAEAEIAFSVEADWRNCGVGTALFARTLRSARNRGFARLYMSCLRHNAPMRALARKFAAEILVELDESVALVEAPRRTIISLLREAIDDAAARSSGHGWEWSRLWLPRRPASPPVSRVG
ncbi:MAG: GNAT family N-acetyltransferase [Beijerinckiaceae bacterium]|jgi:GNAT superfamily N-acetyltransferase|nr:GNAT family N-acetyltransferase [Beijerinckiaceae bacterium]